MARQPASAQPRMRNLPVRADDLASRRTRTESPGFTSERDEPGKPARLPRRQIEQVQELDPDGRVVIHHRLVDSLGRMVKSGAINQAMHDAGCDFRCNFTIAQLDTLRARPILRIPGTRREPCLNDQQIDARRRVHEAMQALGGINSPAGSCIWHVVGCGYSIREWAIRQGWCGRSVEQKEAKGILVAALGMLAGLYGYSEARPGS
jgi:hypothetical protein